MKSKVHLIRASRSEGLPALKAKLDRLLQASEVLSCAAAADAAAVKLHFGEQGNTGFVPPALLRSVVDGLKARKAKPFLSDTNTLYKGRRTDSAEHLRLAHEHGFTPGAVGAEVVIPDDSRPENVVTVEQSGRFIRQAKIARAYAEAQAFVGVAHFKGHIMCGFGGALKNVGMGCATREGKLAQHSDVSPMVLENACTGCGACAPVCSAHAISLNEGRSVIDASLCTGCASCLAACPAGAVQVRWEAGGNVLQEKMVEYSRAVLAAKKGKCAFINAALKITAECDCLAKDDPSVAPDVGLLASPDPVALDQACYDLVVESAGRDVFKEAHPKRDGLRQLAYAEELGLGSRQYALLEVG